MAEPENVEQKINDLDDLEDRLLVLESIVDELKSPTMTTPSLKMVKKI